MTRRRDITFHYMGIWHRHAVAGPDGILARERTFSPIWEELLPEPADISRHIVDLLADRQAEEIALLDVRNVASFADYFVIASAVNPRHMRALVETLEKELRKGGVRAEHREGALDSGWVLLDYGDIIVHLFSPEQRDYYGLEELWQAAKPVVRIQ